MKAPSVVSHFCQCVRLYRFLCCIILIYLFAIITVFMGTSFEVIMYPANNLLCQQCVALLLSVLIMLYFFFLVITFSGDSRLLIGILIGAVKRAQCSVLSE